MTRENRYWQAIKEANNLRNMAANFVKLAVAKELDIEKELGIESHNREPGFPCFTSAKLCGYYSTPQQVARALDKLGDLRNQPQAAASVRGGD